MPNYNYRCQTCKRRATLFFTFSAYETAAPVCPHCGSENLRRRIGRVAIARSDDSHFDGLADESVLAGLDEDDPQALGRLMRKMSSEMGEDLGDEFGEVVDRLEKGQSPEDIEKALPDLGSDAGGGLDLD